MLADFWKIPMKWLLPTTLACTVISIGAPLQAQSGYDICAAHARDAMMAFHSSSAVPVPMAVRARGTLRKPHDANTNSSATTNKAHAPNEPVGSLQSYLEKCLAREP